MKRKFEEEDITLPTSAFNSVPLDVLSYLFSFFSFEDWFSIKLVCRKWKTIADRVFNPSEFNILVQLMENSAEETAIISLLNDERVDPNVFIAWEKEPPCEYNEEQVDGEDEEDEEGEENDNLISLLQWACEKNYLNLIDRLLVHPRLDFNQSKGNEALLSCLIEENPIAAHKLINDSRADPTEFNHQILIVAIRMGYSQIVEKALQYPTIDPGWGNNIPIHTATLYQHPDIVMMFLNDGRVDPFAGLNITFEYACKRGYLEVVKKLLQNKRIDPTAFDRTITDASDGGHLDIVKLLLEDGRADPSIYNNCAIQLAAYRGHEEVVKLLISDPRVDPTTALSEAKRVSHTSIVKLLEDHISSKKT
eukprot:TRINITY_DN12509_c0_g1_i1.p1 TRINITY_DN12509_c0_g1~~TRINITY_DN12509_c0_g1_i1.p1  ORF type:complete len:364 (+),score=69.02 TRINITY_DN12509_c0_g1_i1:103-1194(+)